MAPDFHSTPKPWAVIKHGLLQYVELFLGKLGKSGKKIYYVDGFAGSGKLDDGSEGSPLRVAGIARGMRQSSRRDLLRCINCEKEPGVFAKLETATADFVANGTVKNLCGEFDAKLPEILKLIGDCPALFFIDPFGTQGAELSTLQTIANHARGREVLIRFDDTRVKRLIRLVANHINSLDNTQRKIAEALAKRVAEFATDADVQQTLELLDRNQRMASRDVLVTAYERIVLEQTDFTHALSYPLRNPLTGGHRYFITHFCAHRDGYIYMADFMAKAEHAYLKRSSELAFGNPDQMEFPTIEKDFDYEMGGAIRSEVADALPGIIAERRWRGTTVEARNVYEAIVKKFGWRVLKKEYTAVLREMKKSGLAHFGDLDDGSAITFTT